MSVQDGSAFPPVEITSAASLSKEDASLQLGMTALPRFVNFLHDLPGNFISGQVEATQHLPVVGNGSSYTIREHVRAVSMGHKHVLKVFKKSISPGLLDPITKEELCSLLREIKILALQALNEHENIITLNEIVWGVYSLAPAQLCPTLVLDHAPHGNLYTFQSSVKEVDWSTRINLCLDVACGLEALHASRIVHGDLNGSHILIFDNEERKYQAKITGFGSSLIIGSAGLTQIPHGTVPWNAPEVDEGKLKQDQIFQTDVFSLGVLLWHILIHQDICTSFDLPLDPAARREDFRQILKLPNLYRLIPLLIEHNVGLLDDDEFNLLNTLFSCSVRIAPRQRSLKSVLELLLRRAGRESPKASATEISEVSIKLSEIKASMQAISLLPFVVQRQLIETFQYICDRFNSEKEGKPEAMLTFEPNLVHTALWRMFVCHLRGFGIKASPEAALNTLCRYCSKDIKEFATTYNLLPKLFEALEVDVPDERKAEIAAIQLENKNSDRVGPWIEDRWAPIINPEDYGFKVFWGELAEMCARLEISSSNASNSPATEAELGGGNTLLHGAAFYGMLSEVISLVEEKSANVNALNNYHETPFLLACRVGQYPVAEYLICHGADGSIANDRGETGLHWLFAFPLSSFRVVAVKLASESLAGVLSSDETEGIDYVPVTPDMTFLKDGRLPGGPVLRAVANQDFRSLNLFSSMKKAIISSMEPRLRLIMLFDDISRRPLNLACELHLFEIVEFLLDELATILRQLPAGGLSGPWVSAVAQLDQNPQVLGGLYFAFLDSTAPVYAVIDMFCQVERLLYHGSNSAASCSKTLKVLQKYGFLTNMVRTKRGPVRTLNFAISSGNQPALAFLLEDDIYLKQIDEPDQYGFTPIHYALNHNQFPALSLLVEKGATVDLRKNRHPKHVLSGVGASYMHVLGSLRTEIPAYAEFLMDNGVPPTINDDRRLSALNLALKRGAFRVAKLLIDNGASITSEGIFGLTPLGEVFEPTQAQQNDDLVGTLRFLLSCEQAGSQSLFITNKQQQYSVLHIAAAFYSDDPVYKELVEIVLCHYGKPELLNSHATNPAKSTPLQTAIAMHNHLVVAALVDAGASVEIRDLKNKTPMDVATAMLQKLVYGRAEANSKEKSKKIEHLMKIITFLAEKLGWPAQFSGFPKLLLSLENAMPLLQKMMLSSHQVSFMRHLERATLEMILQGMQEVIQASDVASLSIVRHVIEQRGRPAIRCDIDFRVLPAGAKTPEDSYERVRRAIPWCRNLANARLLDFQQAAAFEYLLDQELQNPLPEAKVEDAETIEISLTLTKYSREPKPANLPFDPLVVKFPLTLLGWYENAVENSEFLITKAAKEQIQPFIAILRKRADMVKRGDFPLAPFDESFRNFHFNILQPAKLEADSLTIAVMIISQCRCYAEKIGSFSRFTIQRLTQRMTSLNNVLWSNRLKKERMQNRKGFDEVMKLRSDIGMNHIRSEYWSQLKMIVIAEQSPDLISLLHYPSTPEDLMLTREPDDEEPSKGTSPLMTLTELPKSTVPYRELDFDREEIRLLTLLPAVSVTQDADKNNEPSRSMVNCTMEHFSLKDGTPEFGEYLSQLPQDVTPSEFYEGWQLFSEGAGSECEIGSNGRKRAKDRFEWGDYTALSYTWGSSNDTRKILINGVEVVVGASLELALRNLSDEPEFVGGLKIWADALCINQADLHEKERVIGGMQSIYLSAESVTVWLGEGHNQSEGDVNAITDYLKHIMPKSIKASEKASEKAVENALTIPLRRVPSIWYGTNIIPPLYRIMELPYWRRLWVMQEISVSAPVRSIFLGKHRLSGLEMTLILRSHILEGGNGAVPMTDEFTEVTHNRISRTIRHVFKLFIMAESYQHSNGLASNNVSLKVMDWEPCLILGSQAHVTDERDRVYGLLGILPQFISTGIKIDYSKSTEAVFIDLSKAIIESLGSSDRLLYGSPNRSESLPSWVIDLRNFNDSHRHFNKASGYLSPYTKFFHDPEAGRTWRSYWAYEIPDSHMPKFEFLDDTILAIKAAKVDEVDGIGKLMFTQSPSSESEVAQMDLQHVGNPYTESVSIEEVLLRVINGDVSAPEDGLECTLFSIPWFEKLDPDPTMVEQLERNQWGAIVQSEEFRVFHGWRLKTADAKMFGKEFREYFTKEVTPCDVEGIRKALHNVATLKERRFITTKRGYLGSTSMQVREGDLVYVVQGCSFTVLLRPKNDGFEVIGECYVEGLMLGEAMTWVDEGKAVIRGSLSPANFYPTIVKGFNLGSNTLTLVLTAPPYLIGAIISFLIAFSSDRNNERGYHIAVPMLAAMVGFIISVATLNVPVRYFASFLYISGCFAANSMVYSWAASALSQTPEKRACATAIINVMGQFGNIWSPYFFIPTESPRYLTAMCLMVAFSVLSVVGCAAMKWTLKRNNTKLINQFKGTGQTPKLYQL